MNRDTENFQQTESEEKELKSLEEVGFDSKRATKIDSPMNLERPHLFSIGHSDTAIKDHYNEAIMNDLYPHFKDVNKIIMNNYRAGSAVTELVLHYKDGHVFTLTIWEGGLDVAPVSSCDIRLFHKEISLPDITDTLLFVTSLARYIGLQPSFPIDDSSSVLEFNS